jgi:hypothetical protein
MLMGFNLSIIIRLTDESLKRGVLEVKAQIKKLKVVYKSTKEY